MGLSQQIQMDLKEDSYVFLLQLFAILARSCACPALE